jgi:hypothetical protein
MIVDKRLFKILEFPRHLQTTIMTFLKLGISGIKIYKNIFADYLNYRELEECLIELVKNKEAYRHAAI